MKLEESLFQILENFEVEIRRTKLLISFVSHKATEQGTELKSISSELGKILTGESRYEHIPQKTVMVPTPLLTQLHELTTTQSDNVLNLPELTFRMAYVHLATLFEAALSDIIRAALIYKPQILKSKRQLTYEEILSEGSMDSLIQKIVEREVSQLTYGSIEEIFEYLQNKLSLPIVLTDEEHQELSLAKANRNILVHNQGKIDTKYIATTNQPNAEIGRNITITQDDCLKSGTLYLEIIQSLVASIERKFRKNQTLPE